jgi:hypothetical protein
LRRVGEALFGLSAFGLAEHAVDHRLVAGFEVAGLDHLLGGQLAALVEVDAGIAEALRAVGLLQLGQWRIAVGDDDALVDGLLDEVREGLVAGVAHDHDAARLRGERLLELLDHPLRRPGRELLVEAVDAESLGRGTRAGLARERRAVAGVSAHLHVDRDALAGRLLRERRGCGRGHGEQGCSNEELGFPHGVSSLA